MTVTLQDFGLSLLDITKARFLKLLAADLG